MVALTLELIVEIYELTVMHLLQQIHQLLRLLGALCLINQSDDLLQILQYTKCFKLLGLLLR